MLSIVFHPLSTRYPLSIRHLLTLLFGVFRQVLAGGKPKVISNSSLVIHRRLGASAPSRPPTYSVRVALNKAQKGRKPDTRKGPEQGRLDGAALFARLHHRVVKKTVSRIPSTYVVARRLEPVIDGPTLRPISTETNGTEPSLSADTIMHCRNCSILYISHETAEGLCQDSGSHILVLVRQFVPLEPRDYAAACSVTCALGI